MKTKLNTRVISLLLIALMMLPMMTPLMAVFAADQTTYVLDVGTLPDVPTNTKQQGDTDTCGTDNFFTLHYKAATKVEANSKNFLGFSATKRIDFQGATDFTDLPAGCISFTTQASATVKVFWVSGDNGRQVCIYDENKELVAQTAEDSVKNSLYVSTLTLDSEGTYYLGGVDGNNYIYKVEVTTKTLDKGPRADWSTVAAPSFESAVANEDGTIGVSVNALVDHNGADYLIVNMYKDGQVVSTANSTSIKALHALVFNPVESGTYEFEAIISREGEEDKISEKVSLDYVLPLALPYITIASNLGNGSLNVIWNPTREAEKYNVYVNGTLYETTENRDITITGLEVGKLAQIDVEAVRGTAVSEKSSVKVTIGNEKRDWNFTVYGPSTNSSKNDNYFADNNKDGSVQVFSVNGKGKLQPTGADGLSYYYTAVPSSENFTFRATIKVNSWTYSNGQDGFGLMVMDHVPSGSMPNTSFWSNLYMAVATKIEYRYEDIEDGEYNIYTTDSILGDKYSMKLGIGSISKIGIDQSIIDRTTLGETGLIVGQTGYLQSVVQTLECQTGLLGKPAGTYNIIGNYTNATAPEGTLDERYLVTEMTLEIQKNNTGYFITYYDKDGNVVRTIKNYEPDALEVFDSEYVYVGMFASRNANVTFSNISLTTIAKEDDKPAEERPITKIDPTVTVTSSSSITTTDYNLVADFNVAGTADVYVNNVKLLEGVEVKANERLNTVLDLNGIARYDIPNALKIVFTPDADQELPPYTALSTTNAIWHTMDITLYKGNYHKKTIYVAPDGMYYGNGSKEHPYDIYTAIKLVVPGQTIVLMEGTYKLETGLRIERGINGTEELPIRMIADPDAKTRPILDFVRMGNGITHGGNWWYFFGFDVTNTIDGSKGFQVSGNNNVLDQINAYYNGNTGIQISRYHVVDLTIDQWPANNLILNCTSYGNADSGYEDADGFAAKLTIGEGNVFDGCVAHHNADDGWDLFAKIATGEIGAVVIRNCVAYANGYLEDGTNAGNGNGFKMGGDSLPGQHQLINSIAFNNKAKGIDSNSCPDIIVTNCISYNNGSHNVAFYTNSANNTDFVANGIISIKDSNAVNEGFGTKEQFKPLGNQDVDKYDNNNNYYWNGEACVNKAGEELTTNIFVSTEFKGIVRNADGTINMQGFLELNATVPSGIGTTGASTPSAVIELVPDEECTFSEDWITTDMYVHWHECECGNKADIEEHTLEYVTDLEPTETTSGYKHNECTVCGHKRATIEIPPLGNGNNNTDTTNTSTNAGGILGFFQMIWRAIVNFFRMIFGLR